MVVENMEETAQHIIYKGSDLIMLGREQLEELLAMYEINCLDRWRIRLVWAGCIWDGSYIYAHANDDFPLLHKSGTIFAGDKYTFAEFNARFLRLWAEILEIHYDGLSIYSGVGNNKSLHETHSYYAK